MKKAPPQTSPGKRLRDGGKTLWHRALLACNAKDRRKGASPDLSRKTPARRGKTPLAQGASRVETRKGRLFVRRCWQAEPAPGCCRRTEHETSRHRLKRLVSSNLRNSPQIQTVEKPPESSRGSQPSRTFNRAQRHVRWARGDFCAGKSHFPEQKSFPCRLRARKIFDF